MLAGEVVAVEVNAARARELEENVAPARRDERPGRLRRRPRPAGGADRASTGRSSTRRAPGSASSPPGPICAGARSRCRSSSSSCCSAAAARVRPGGTRRLLRLHRQPRRGRGGRRRLRARGRRHRSPPRGRSSATRAARSSCRRCRTSTARAASSSPGLRDLRTPRADHGSLTPVGAAERAVGSRHGLGELDPRRERDRAVALRRRLHAPR